MKIDEALEEFDFFNEGDYITRGMSIAKDVVLQELKNKDKEIEYWKEQAEGYSGLAEQIKEDFENRDRWE